MKKTIVCTSLLLLTLLLNSSAYCADTKTEAANKTKEVKEFKMPPKFYDKEGNELKAPPKPGEAVYDKDGNKLPVPNFMKNRFQKPELNLTDKQKEKADKIRENSRKKIKPIRREIHNLKNEIWEIKENDDLTMEEKFVKIKPLHEKIKALRTQANEIRKEDMKQFEKLLTKDQKKTLEEFKKNHKPDFKKKPCPCQKDMD